MSEDLILSVDSWVLICSKVQLPIESSTSDFPGTLIEVPFAVYKSMSLLVKTGISLMRLKIVSDIREISAPVSS